MTDAEQKANDMIQTAKQKQATIIDDKRKQANETAISLIEQAERQARDLKEQTISRAHIKARDTKLTAKGELINDVLHMTLERLNNLDDETYVQFLHNRLEKIDLKGTELLIVPEDKRDLVNKLNLPLKVSDDKTVNSGFHLVDDRLIMNYTFSSIVTFHEDELQLIIARILFNE